MQNSLRVVESWGGWFIPLTLSTQLHTSHSARMQKAFAAITKCNCSLKRKQRCSPMGSCEAFTCVKVVGFFFAISEWPQWSPGWREERIPHGWATTGLTSSKGGGTGNVPLWGSCQGLEDFPVKRSVDVPHPCLTLGHPNSRGKLRKAVVRQTSVLWLCFTLEHGGVKHSHPDDLEVGDCFLSFREKKNQGFSNLRKRTGWKKSPNHQKSLELNPLSEHLIQMTE